MICPKDKPENTTLLIEFPELQHAATLEKWHGSRANIWLFHTKPPETGDSSL
jgi:hypothetical protein